MKFKPFIFTIILLLTISFIKADPDIYVSQHNTSPKTPKDGSINNPFQSITEALDFIAFAKDSGPSGWRINIAPGSAAYEISKSYEFHTGSFKGEFAMKKWENAPLPEGQADDLPRVNFTESKLDFNAVSNVELTSLSLIPWKGEIDIKEKNLKMKNLIFDGANLNEATAFITVKGADAEINEVKINVSQYNTLVRVINENENRNSLIMLNKIDFIIGNSTRRSGSVGGQHPLFDLQDNSVRDGSEKYNLLAHVEISNICLNSTDFESKLLIKTLIRASGFFEVYFENFTVTNMQNFLETYLPMFDFENIHQMMMINFNLANNSLGMQSKYALFSIESVSFLEVSNLNVTSNQIAFRGFEKKESHFLFQMQFVRELVLNNNTITDNIFGDRALTFFSFIPYSDLSLKYRLDLNMTNITISSNSYGNSGTPAISYLNCDGPALDKMNIENFTLSDNSISGKILNFITDSTGELSTSDDNVIPAPNQRVLRRVLIMNNNNASDFNFFSFSPTSYFLDSDECLQISPLDRIDIYDFKMENNSFTKRNNDIWTYEPSIFQVKQSSLNFYNLIMKDNNFNRCNFLNLDIKPSNLIINNSQILNQKFVKSRFVTTNYLKGYSCTIIKDSIARLPVLLYRFAFIEDSVFEKIDLVSGSLLTVDNGFFSMKNTTIKNIWINESSTLISTKFSPLNPFPGQTVNNRNVTLEAEIFKGYPEMLTPFNKIMERINSENVAYFYSLHNNSFEKIKYENSTMIVLEKFNLESSFIEIFENKFIQVEVNFKDLAVSMIDITGFKSLRIRQNTFKKIEGSIKPISLQQSGENKELQITKNTIEGVMAVPLFISYSSKKIERFEFTENNIHALVCGGDCITIESEYATEDWLFADNQIEDGEFESYEGLTQDSGFISLKVLEAAPSLKLIFKNNILKSMRLSSQMSDEKSNLVHLYTAQSVAYLNNTIEGAKLSSYGSILEIKTRGTLMIRDSEIKRSRMNSKFKGMINFDATEVLVEDNIFTQIENRVGAGLFNRVQKNDKTNHLKFTLRNCTFDGIVAAAYGSLFTSLSTNEMNLVQFEMKNCSVRNMKDTNLFSLRNFLGQLMIEDCDIEIKNVESNPMLLDQMQGSVVFRDVRIRVLSNTPGYFIQMTNSPKCSIQFDTVSYEGNNSGLSLITMDSGYLRINFSKFKNILLSKYPLISVAPSRDTLNYTTSIPEVSFYQSAFQNISMDNNDDTVFVYSDVMEYDHSIGMNSMIRSLIYSVLPTKISSGFSTFQNISRVSIFVSGHSKELEISEFSSSIYLSSSTFEDNSGASFGTVLTVLPKSYDPVVNINNCSFTENSAMNTGLLTVYNSVLTVKDSSFTYNRANLGRAIYMGNKTARNSILENNTFQNNQGTYPGDVRSEALDFKIEYISQDDKGTIKASDGPASEEFSNASLVLLDVSHHEIQKGFLAIGYIDIFGIEVPDFSEQRIATFEIPMNEGSKSQVSFNAYVEDCDMNICTFSLRNLLLTGFAGKNVSLNLKFSSERMKVEKSILLSFRDCLPGESRSGDTCQRCQAPTFSVDPSEACSTCPANADCPDQSKVCPKQNYWNPHPHSLAITQCRIDDILRCANDNGCQSCAEGYAGPLCETCDFAGGYVETGFLKCGKCKSAGTSLMFSVASFALFTIYKLGSIYLVYTGNKKMLANDGSGSEEEISIKKDVERSYYIKILLTYTQLMSVLCMGSSNVLAGLGLTSQIGNPAALVTYGTQCSMKALNVDFNDFLYYQTYFVLSSPLIELILIVVLFILFKKCLDVNIRQVSIVALLYLIISFQPGLVGNLSQFLSCRKIPGVENSIITAHAHWSCDDARYKTIADYVAIPSLIVWCLVVPVIIFIMLYRRRSQLQTEEVNTTMGVFMKEVKPEYYYWGVVLMIMKVCLTFLIYGGHKNDETKICISLLLIWGYQALLRAKKPYKEEEWNDLEIRVMNLLMFNVIAVKYLVNPNNGEWISYGSIGLILILNGGFVLMTGKRIFTMTSSAALEYLAKRKKNQEKEKEKLLLAQENDDSCVVPEFYQNTHL